MVFWSKIQKVKIRRKEKKYKQALRLLNERADDYVPC